MKDVDPRFRERERDRFSCAMGPYLPNEPPRESLDDARASNSRDVMGSEHNIAR